MPQVIADGRVYAAVPPLYSIPDGKKGRRYFTDKTDFAKYIEQQFIKLHEVLHVKGKKRFTNSEYLKFFYRNIDYAYTMNILKDIFAVDPHLLELVLLLIADVIDFGVQSNIAVASFAKANTATTKEEVKNLVDNSIVQSVQYSLAGLSYTKFKSAIEKAFPFVKVQKKNGIIVISGEVDYRTQYIFINDYFIRNCIDMINLIKDNAERYFIMDGRRVAIYDIMQTFDNIMPNVKRYKGLGEMKVSELAESTLVPENRTLIRYTIESAKDEINKLRSMDSNFASLLNTVRVSRQDVE